MWNFINRNYWNVVIVTAVVLVLICGIGILVRGDDTNTPMLTNAINVVTSPVKTTFSEIGNGIGGFFENITSGKKAIEENKQLKNRIKTLENENAKIEEYKIENDRLRRLLDFKTKQQSFNTVACEVIGRTFSSWNATFILNKGISSGVDVGNVVIDNGGLVGRITMAGNNWAQVTTLLDGESAVSARVIRSGEDGIVEGDIEISENNLCMFNYSRKDADITIGDTVETSGLGKKYPAGIIIGKVKSVEIISGQVNKKITVEISADIYNLKEVLVIIG